jgi:DUF917 family protein
VTKVSVLKAQDIDALVVGVELLGSGGGGDAATFARVLRRRLGDGRIDLHTPADLAEGVVVPVGVVGSISVFLEKLPSGEELAGAVNAVCRWAGVQATAVMSLEAGGLNGITGLVASLDVGLPFLDADLMGRALPRLDQFSWAVEGLPLTPCALYEPGGQIVVFDSVSPSRLERAVRVFLSQTGGWGALALPPLPVPTAVSAALTGSISRALELGRAHSQLGETPLSDAVERVLGGRVLADGRVIEVSRHGNAGAFARGSTTVIDSQSRAVVRIETENEYLLALVDGRVEVSTPDLLCLLDRRTARPLAIDQVRTGDEVLVVALPGPSWWAENEHRLAAVGPSSFGLNTDAMLLETRS